MFSLHACAGEKTASKLTYLTCTLNALTFPTRQCHSGPCCLLTTGVRTYERQKRLSEEHVTRTGDNKTIRPCRKGLYIRLLVLPLQSAMGDEAKHKKKTAALLSRVRLRSPHT